MHPDNAAKIKELEPAEKAWIKDDTPASDQIEERNQLHGEEFAEVANLSQGMKFVVASGRQWNTLPEVQKEAIEQIAHHLSRIVNGSSTLDDWSEIAHYAHLVTEVS